MSTTIYISLTLFFATLIQIILGNSGIIVALVPLAIFYFTVTFGWEKAIISAVCSGILLDILYGRTLLISPVLCIIIVLIGMIWLHKGETAIMPFQMIPSGVISFLYIFPFLYYEYQKTEFGLILLLNTIGIFIISSLITTVIFPIMIRFLDILNKPLGFGFYRSAQRRLRKNQ